MNMHDAIKTAAAEYDHRRPDLDAEMPLTDIAPPVRMLGRFPVRTIAAGDARIIQRVQHAIPELDELDAAILVMYILTRTHAELPQLVDLAADPIALMKTAEVWSFNLPMEDMLHLTPMVDEINRLSSRPATAADGAAKKKIGSPSTSPSACPSSDSPVGKQPGDCHSPPDSDSASASPSSTDRR